MQSHIRKVHDKMKFLNYIEELKHTTSDDIRLTSAQSYWIGHIPGMPEHFVRHKIYAPMPEDALQYLKNSYLQEFPKPLEEFYRTANGCALCAGILLIGKYPTPWSRLTVYGFPIGEPQKERDEPYSIQVEDLSRPRNCPKCWLKFGSYSDLKFGKSQGEYDLFVDVITGTIYGVTMRLKKMDLKHPEFCWNSMDECLCSLYEKVLQDMKDDEAYEQSRI